VDGKHVRQRPARVCSVTFETWINESWDTCDLVTPIVEGLSFLWMRVPMKIDLKAGESRGDLRKVDLDKMTLSALKQGKF
jgi:hypothetical protein